MKHNTSYFKKYNTIIVILDNNINDIKKVLLLGKKYGFNYFSSFAENIVSNNYFKPYLRFWLKDMDFKYGNFLFLKEADRVHNLKYDNINQLNIIENILKYGENRPSYKPKKIIRE